MQTFWVLGRHFADDHDRAIRFVDLPSGVRKKAIGVPGGDNKISDLWCDKCNAWHLVRTTQTLTTPIRS